MASVGVGQEEGQGMEGKGRVEKIKEVFIFWIL